MRKTHKFVALAALVGWAGIAIAAERTILGRSLSVKDPTVGADPAKRKVTSTAKEKSSPDTIVGDPTLAGSAGGAILDVFAFGGTSTSQQFVLQQGTSSLAKPFWVQTGTTGFKYKDVRGDQGPVKSVLIRRSPSGSFTIKAKITGRNGAVNVIPPAPGTNGCVALKIGVNALAGDRYSIQFGPESQIKNVDGKLFKAKKPGLEGICPPFVPTTTTTSTTVANPTSTSSSTITLPTLPSTTTTTSSTTTTTLYGSPSRAFVGAPFHLLD